jgi:diguanylate cyclase (GGDEF)-like protein/PAS domain S-box-containing protein
MNKDTAPPHRQQVLRRRAEDNFHEKSTVSTEIPGALLPEDVGHTLKEFQVYQLELEMQNDALRNAQVELDAERARYFDLYDHAPMGYLTVREDGSILQANLTVAAMLGVVRDALVGQPIARFIFQEDQDIFHFLKNQLLKTGKLPLYELRMSKTGGSLFWVFMTATAVHDEDGETTLRVVMNDITGRKAMDEELQQLAFYDVLTGLPNRRLLNERLQQTMASSKRRKFYCALMFLDLDNFKPLNDIHGHAAGDLLLLEVASRLKNCVREIDTVARFGGDEFVVLLTELNVDKAESKEHAALVAEKIRHSLSEVYLLPTSHDGRGVHTVEHHCSASIGVVLFVNHEATMENILSWADAAMYQAKDAGQNLIRFHQEKSND